MVYEFYAVDPCGNESPHELRTYAVVDNTPPEIFPPDDITVECPPPVDGPESEEEWRDSATASDTCGEATPLWTLVRRTDGCGNTYVSFYDFWAVDECGNESSREQRKYEVIDTTPPVFTKTGDQFDQSIWPPNPG